MQPGREEEGKKYFDDAINGNMDEMSMSPLQAIIRNPNSWGTVDVKAQPGQVIVTYRFLYDEIDGELR